MVIKALEFNRGSLPFQDVSESSRSTHPVFAWINRVSWHQRFDLWKWT